MNKNAKIVVLGALVFAALAVTAAALTKPLWAARLYVEIDSIRVNEMRGLEGKDRYVLNYRIKNKKDRALRVLVRSEIRAGSTFQRQQSEVPLGPHQSQTISTMIVTQPVAPEIDAKATVSAQKLLS